MQKTLENAVISDVVYHYSVMTVVVLFPVYVLHKVIALSILRNTCEVYLAYRWTLLRQQRPSILSPSVTQNMHIILFHISKHTCNIPQLD